MILRREVLERIAGGDVDVVFRRWRRPTVRAGGTLKTAIGVLEIVSLDRVEERDVTAADAARAGFASRETLLDELGEREGALYRIEVRLAGDDPRIALRERQLDDGELEELRARLARMDGRAPDGAWTRHTLAAIEGRPGVVSTELARSLGVERALFKRRVRRLKELGLTESLEEGYRLSGRGRDALRRFGPAEE